MEIGPTQLINGVGEEYIGSGKLIDRHGPIVAGPEFGDALGIDVEADGTFVVAKGDRHRQAHVAEADY